MFDFVIPKLTFNHTSFRCVYNTITPEYHLRVYLKRFHYVLADLWLKFKIVVEIWDCSWDLRLWLKFENFLRFEEEFWELRIFSDLRLSFEFNLFSWQHVRITIVLLTDVLSY